MKKHSEWRWKKKWVSELEERPVEMIQVEEQSRTIEVKK